MTWTTFVWALLAAVLSATIVVGVLRLQDHMKDLLVQPEYYVNARIQLLELQQQQKALQARIDDLERTVYGVTKQPPSSSGPQTWQKNRDKELRDRILALEKWRYSQKP